MEIGNNIDQGSSSSLQDIGLEENRSPQHDDHDQLPNVEEYKASQRHAGDTSSTQLKARLTVGVMVMISCIMIMTGIAVGNRKNAARDAAPDNEHSHLSSRGQDIATFVVNMGWARLDSTKNSFSAQSKAINWLAEEDPMKLEVSVDNEFMQRYLLTTIYYALNGPNWIGETNFLTDKETCQWNNRILTQAQVEIQIGALCRDGESIKEIFLPKLNLHGVLPEEFGLLLDLEDLNLFQNNLQGAIPDEWKNLKSLKTLILHDNKIGGNLPEWISSIPLKTLNLAENRFVGEVPDLTGMQDHIETISLEHNAFMGDLSFLNGLFTVRSIYLGNNKFKGSITNMFLDHFEVLEIFDVSDNLLSGPLPEDLFTMDNLVVLDFHGNKFSGSLPEIAVLGSPLRFLALQNNQIRGPIGNRLNMFTELEHLDLSANFFTGTMPSQLGTLTELRYLYLAFNINLDPGPIPSSFAKLPKLKDLSLQKTNRTGEIPFTFLDDYALELLDLNDNELTGEIPEELSRLSNLIFLLLKQNKLSGTIPHQLGRLKNLNMLLLDDNNLTGGIETTCEQPIMAALKSKTFVADCDEFSDTCTCCSVCCKDEDETCNDVVWFSDLDPIAEENYARTEYVFDEADIVYDLTKPEEIPDYYQNFSGYSFIDEDYTVGIPP